MMRRFTKFKNDETGAVTVDWVLLTAAVVGLATVLVVELKGGSAVLTERTGSFLETYQPGE